MKTKQLIKRLPPFTLTAIVTAAVLYLTLVPKPLPDNDIEWFEGADKVVHAIMMLGITGSLGLDYMRRYGQAGATSPRIADNRICTCHRSIWWTDRGDSRMDGPRQRRGYTGFYRRLRGCIGGRIPQSCTVAACSPVVLGKA